MNQITAIYPLFFSHDTSCAYMDEQSNHPVSSVVFTSYGSDGQFKLFDRKWQLFPYDMKPAFLSPFESQPMTVEISVFIDGYIRVIKPGFIRDSVHAFPPLPFLLSSISESRSTLQIHSCAMYLFKARCVVLCVVAYFTALGSLGNYDHCNRSMTLVIFPF